MKNIIGKIITYIKEEYKFLIVCAIVVFLGLFKLPYNLYTGGGIIDISDKVDVENASKVEGSFNMAYVKQVRATIPTYLLSYIFDWDREKVSDTLLDKNDTPDDLWERERIYMNESNTLALVTAFRLAGEYIEITNEKSIVLYTVYKAKTDLKVGDEIITVDGQEIHEDDDLSNIVHNHKLGDIINIKVRRDGKEMDCYAEVITYDDDLKIGVALTKYYDYKTNRNVKFNIDDNEAGPSGGLMLTLEIYNQLINEDITHGYKIAGTGTIDNEGKVGKIAGIKYKLKGAESAKAKVFFVAPSNYEEAINEKEAHNYKIEVVKVETVSDAISYLKEMK